MAENLSYQTKCFDMKKLLLSLATLLVITACNNSNNEDDAEMKDPTETQTVSEAIPDSMKLVNDSVIVPGVAPNNGVSTGKADSAQQK
jgi:hypothetical protein